MRRQTGLANRLVDVGYIVTVDPWLASYRFRVAIPAPHTGLSYSIGEPGEVSFFYKHFEPIEIAQSAKESGSRIVYDVVNEHLEGEKGVYYRSMIALADAVTCGSEWMRRRILDATGKTATVIDDPWETDEAETQCEGRDVLWFGHGANLRSALHAFDAVFAAKANPVVCSNAQHKAIVPWSPEEERRQLERCALVLLTASNPGASTNRVVKALRSGRFVIAQDIESWRELRDYIWIGDIRQGVEWALSNRQQALEKVRAGQEYVREKKSPQAIGRAWSTVMRPLLSSISVPETTISMAG